MNTAHVREQLLMLPPTDTDAEEESPVGGSSESTGGALRDSLGGGSAGVVEDIQPTDTAAEGRVAEAARAVAAAVSFVNESAEETNIRSCNDGAARGTLAGLRLPMGAVRHVFSSSIAARVRDDYEKMSEASLSVPVASPSQALVPSKLTGAGMRKVLEFTVSAGGCGLSLADQHSLAETLYAVEAQLDYSAGDHDVFKALILTPASSASGTRTEQNQVLARLGWMEVPIVINDQVRIIYYRDLLKVGVDAVQSAANVDLLGGELYDAADGSRRHSCFLDSDLFNREVSSVQSLHGPEACPLVPNR